MSSTSGVKSVSSKRRPIDLNFNSTNIVAGTNNSRMKFTFQSGNVDITGKEICLKKFSIYNSFPAITTATSFTYTWWDNTTVTVSLAANTNYSASDLNDLLQYTMFINHHFLYDTATSPDTAIYYASIIENPVKYAIDLQSLLSPVNLALSGTAYQVPFDSHLASSFTVTGTNLLTITCANTTADGTPAIIAGDTFLISGCTAANNLQWNNTLQVAASANATTVTVTLVGATNYGATAETVAIVCPPTASGAPLWIFPSTRANLQFNLSSATVLALLGFTAGSYPTTLTGTQANYSISSNSGVAPQLNPVSAILIHCDFVTQQLNMYPTILDVTDLGDSVYGGIISYAPNVFSYQPCGNGSKESISIFLTDQNGTPLVVLDNQWNVTVQLRDVEEAYKRET